MVIHTAELLHRSPRSSGQLRISLADGSVLLGKSIEAYRTSSLCYARMRQMVIDASPHTCDFSAHLRVFA